MHSCTSWLMRPERDYRQPAIGTGRNCNGGIWYRGKLTNPDKYLYIVAGKLLGRKSQPLSKCHPNYQLREQAMLRLQTQLWLLAQLAYDSSAWASRRCS